MQARTERVHMMLVEQTVYHARELRRSCGQACRILGARQGRTGGGMLPAAGARGATG